MCTCTDAAVSRSRARYPVHWFFRRSRSRSSEPGKFRQSPFQGFALGIEGPLGRRRNRDVSSLGKNQSESLQTFQATGFALTLPARPAGPELPLE